MTRALALLAFLALAGCGSDPDPCAAVTGTCITVQVRSETVEELDHLELDVLYGDLHGTTTTQPSGGGVAPLPLATAIALDLPAPAPVGVVAAAKLAGVVLGTGAGQLEVTPGARPTLTLALAAPADCTPGGFYCGGDKLAGDPQTIYACNGGGVPLARGRCAFGCIVRPTDDDVCRGGGGTCVDGGHYCGGDKLDGDPATLYVCAAGAGTLPQRCANGCEVRPGDDDRCR